ncbi:DUF1573 domain-containing protein [Opitutales bacterium ASA1]|nr:DUF1573 domain-containing protein [Opitutales bacterium ASA1]
MLVGVSPLSAALEWESRRIQHVATPGESAFEGVFVFRNAGEAAVAISSVTSSCGCTVPALEKRVYAPGESGRIVAKFTYGDRVGRQVKTVNVQTDDPGTAAAVLTLEVAIPETIAMRPRFLIWKRGEGAVEKTVSVRIQNPDAVKDLAVRVPDERFSARLEPTDLPEEFTIVVAPRDTETVTNASLQLTATVGDAPQRLTLFLGVR